MTKIRLSLKEYSDVIREDILCLMLCVAACPRFARLLRFTSILISSTKCGASRKGVVGVLESDNFDTGAVFQMRVHFILKT